MCAVSGPGWQVGVRIRCSVEPWGVQELFIRGWELVLVVSTCVDAIMGTHWFRPEASTRLSDEILVALLVCVPALLVGDFNNHYLPVGLTCPGPAVPR